MLYFAIYCLSAWTIGFFIIRSTPAVPNPPKRTHLLMVIATGADWVLAPVWVPILLLVTALFCLGYLVLRRKR